MTINDPEYSPDPYAHAVGHLDAAEDLKEDAITEHQRQTAMAEALIGIGWAILANAKKE